MQIDTAENLMLALRDSGLFTSEQLLVLTQDLAAVKGDFASLVKHLVGKNRITEYQIKKVIRGKSSELLLGPYVISYRVGEGGMGRVYRATHSRLGREVALKVVRDHLLANPIVRKRYDREVETASSLNHPNIVSVYDAGEVDGKYYLAMEFVDGIDLSRLSREYRPLLIPEACEYIRQAALGLQYAHDQGFVHRDVKPSNIIVAGERHIPGATEPAVVKILDMGLVRSVGFEDGGGGDLTRAGTVVGTPDYMSPEQAKNSSGVDHRADLYSLGCTLYFLLSGQPPYPVGTAIEKLLKHQLDAATPLQALRPEIPSEVAEVVSRLMAKKPADRIQSAAEVAERLLPLSTDTNSSRPKATSSRRHRRMADVQEQMGSAAASTVPNDFGQTHPNDLFAQPAAANPPIAEGDLTPQPEDVKTVLHAVLDNGSPFSVMTESPRPASTRDSAIQATTQAGQRWRILGLLIAAGILTAIAFVWILWMVFGRKTPPPQPSVETPQKVTGGSAIASAVNRPASVPVASHPRLLPVADLLVDDPALAIVVTPANYPRDKDSPYLVGVGPGRLESWFDRIRAASGLVVGRSERLVLSIPAGRINDFLLVSEGDYLSQQFVASLSANPKLVPVKTAMPLGVAAKEFTAAQNFSTALLSPPAGSPVYALTDDRSLLAGLGERLTQSDKPQTRRKIDSAMLAMLNQPQDAHGLLLAVAGPQFSFPFTFQSVDKPVLTLNDFGIELMLLNVTMAEQMQLELRLISSEPQSFQKLLNWLVQKTLDEYPRDGAIVVNLLGRSSKTFEQVDGKFRLIMKSPCTPEQWSSFLERALGG